MADEQESIYKALTRKQRKFVDAYLETLNATEAARRAGYSDKSSGARVRGSELLANRNVRTAIDERLAEQVMSANEVLSRLTEQASVNISDFFLIDEDGAVGDVNTAYLKEHGNLVKKIKVEKDKVELELYDGQNALVQLGRRWGVFTDKMDVKVTEQDVDAAIVAELAKLEAARQAKATG
jgi:phage terminase small subunit